MRTRGELLVGLLASAGAVVFVTAAIAVLKPYVPVLSLGVLYISRCCRSRSSGASRSRRASRSRACSRSTGSSCRRRTRSSCSDGANWLALAVYLVTGVVVSALGDAGAPTRASSRARARPLEAEALRRSDTMKTALLHAVSHDLRSPLTAIVAAASGLGNPSVRLLARDRDELVDDDPRPRPSGSTAIVGNLLDLSRLESGVAAPHQELWTADDLVSRALDAARPAAASAS